MNVELPQRYMLTAMAVIRWSLTDVIDRHGGRRRLLDIQLAVIFESYREDYVKRLGRAAEIEHEALSRRAARTEHRYVNAIEPAHLLVIGLEGSGKILLFNREAERVSGPGAHPGIVEGPPQVMPVIPARGR